MSINRELDRLKKNMTDLERLERGYIGMAFVYAELIAKHTYRKVRDEITHAKYVCMAVWYYTLISLGIVKK